MITHAGNVIIPGPGLLDPNAMKNFLIDTLFAPEVGNVQRYLILMHMHNILTIAEIKVPNCCNQSMILKEGYLLCYCSEDCGHQPVPKCCGQNMTYKEI